MAQTTDHKEARATVRVVYRSTDTRSDGTNPFFICITKQRKRKYIATGLTLHPKYWNETTGEIRKSYPANLKRELEQRLKVLVEKYEKADQELAEDDEPYDVSNVASKAVEGRKQARRTTLLAYIDTIVEGMVKARQIGNSIVYRDLRNQLAKFIADEYKIADLSFDKVTVSFCEEWENTLRSTAATDNTLSNRFRTLRAVLNRAIANGYAKPDSYPFARNVAEKHKFSIGKFDTSTSKRAISREDIRRIENFSPAVTSGQKQINVNEVERLILAKNVFLFSFYVAGINVVDIAKLRWANVSADETGNYRVDYVRQKTGGKFSLRILPAAVTIIEQYRSLTHIGPNSYVFPILNEAKHITTSQIHNRVHKVSAMINADLKTIGEQCDITTPLTTYVARHSFATSLRASGIPDAVTGQAMGHKDASVTAVYLKSFASDVIDTAFDALL